LTTIFFKPDGNFKAFFADETSARNLPQFMIEESNLTLFESSIISESF